MSKSLNSTMNDSFLWPVNGTPADVNDATTIRMADILRLDFVTRGPSHEDNLCFVQSADLRDEFKTAFMAIDVADYAHAMLHSHNYRAHLAGHPGVEVLPVPYPANSTLFWKLVRLGGQLRKECTSETSMEQLMKEIDTVVMMEKLL